MPDYGAIVDENISGYLLLPIRRREDVLREREIRRASQQRARCDLQEIHQAPARDSPSCAYNRAVR
jgi:hypothetical protein